MTAAFAAASTGFECGGTFSVSINLPFGIEGAACARRAFLSLTRHIGSMRARLAAFGLNAIGGFGTLPSGTQKNGDDGNG